MSDIGSKQYLCIFGGGAIRGLAYLGALRAMKEIGVQIKSFAGSSVGAVFAAYASLDYKLPNIMASLRDYQVVGFKWLKLLNKYHLGGILADEMGLGKTLEVITLLSSLDSNLPVLIISPKSLIFNWYNEINRFNSNLKVISIYGDGKERIKIINNIKEEFIIYLTSYESILRDIELYQDINFNYVILDEAQAIKNVLALKSKAVKTLKCENKLCLTGTPIENNIIDLWSIFDFLKDLPEKFETLITVELNETERKIYDAEIMLARKALKENNKIFSILPYLIKLREICLSSSLVTNYNKISSKLNMLIEIVQTYLKNNHKILIFSSFVEGLIPSLAGRSFTENFPNPTNVTSPLSLSPATIPSRTASNARPASALLISAFSAT